MFKHVGFFHFGHGHNDPIGSLSAALDEAADVSDSLIVLPEAFNIRRKYREKRPTPNFGLSVLGDLRDIASARGISFVAGLIIDDTSDVAPPYSSAYYIDRDSKRLMCRKGGEEDRAGVNYTPFGSDDCDIDNPIEHNDACIAAMVCMDIDEYPQRYRDLSCKTASSSQRIRVFCVPAHMGSTWSLLANGHLGYSLRCVGLRVVVANSKPDGHASFVTDPSGVVVDEVSGDVNKVVLAPVDPLK